MFELNGEYGREYEVILLLSKNTGSQLSKVDSARIGIAEMGQLLVPGSLSVIKNLCDCEFMCVHYVSDLHLETWYEKHRDTMSMSDFIETVVDSLFNSIAYKGVVLFLGDIADSFAVSKMFYEAFVGKWDIRDDVCRQEFEQHKVDLIAQDEIDRQMVEEYKALHPWTKRANKSLRWYERTPIEIKDAICRMDCLEAELNREFKVLPRHIVAVLGNHEIHEFSSDNNRHSYERGKQKYKALFQTLGIRFLDMGEMFEYSNYFDNDFVFVGFCGFDDPENGYAVIGNYEINIRDEQLRWYEHCVEYVKSRNAVLVFCSHFPLSSGVVNRLCSDNAYYFCGHTHRNDFIVLGDTSAIVADNQIGYGWNSNNKFKFAHLGLYTFCNPFEVYIDGCYEIEIEAYRRFSFHIREYVTKVGSIENYIEKGGTFYLLKSRGYYGFFIENKSAKRVYICNGGSVKLVRTAETIDEIVAQFDVVVNAYLSVFSGLRKYQEQIASYVRRFGGEGKIHGLIVDIDFYNHVGIDPTTGSVTFYYSPMFGEVQEYSDIGVLLEHHAPALYPAYKELAATGLVPYQPQEIAVEGELMDVPRGGNSFYGASKYMAPVQRLFSCNILRVWDEKVLNAVMPRLGDGDST